MNSLKMMSQGSLSKKMQFPGLIKNTEVIVNIDQTAMFKIEIMRQQFSRQTTSGDSLTKMAKVQWRYFYKF